MVLASINRLALTLRRNVRNVADGELGQDPT